MTNTTYHQPLRDDESVASSSSDLSYSQSQQLETLKKDPTRSLYSGIRKRIGSIIRSKSIETDAELEGIDKNLIHFSYSELRMVTDNFRRLIGGGIYQVVYKGILSDGREVAVKIFRGMYNQELTEFVAELTVIPVLQHRNVLRLYGFCSEGDNRFLVYEYLENQNLQLALHGIVGIRLGWKTRCNICLGIAKGLAYLHEESMPRIVHGDVRPYNILLDSSLNPKISGFGLARIFPDEDTHVSTVVKETFGYADPHCVMTGQLTEKSDVYAFGVTVLEILSGRQVLYDIVGEYTSLVDLACTLNENNRALELVDPSLFTFNIEQARQMLEVAVMCTREKRILRPPMSQVVIMLMKAFESEQGPSGSSTPKTQTTQLQSADRTSGSSTLITRNDSFQSASNSSIWGGADLPPQLTPEDMDALRGMSDLLTSFGYDELRIATADFDTSNKLGQGGFGHVFKGILTDERDIAVKKLSETSHQGNSQFLAEIFTISAVQHHNIVKLYGYCIEDENRLLVYEYLANKSLDQALFGKNALHLDWTARHNICLGIARGLACLHEVSKPRIILRDLKSSNILLDKDLNPKISDFGLAKLFDDTKTHVSTRFGGTLGYIAPEYAMRGRLTQKVDVYAFGIVTLEILCGRPVNDSNLGLGKTYLLELVWSLCESNRGLELVDPSLKSFNEKEAIRMLSVALLCTQASPKMRPTMSQVVAMLTGANEVTVAEKPSYLCD